MKLTHEINENTHMGGGRERKRGKKACA